MTTSKIHYIIVITLIEVYMFAILIHKFHLKMLYTKFG